jgi:hypothetical protein
MLMTQLTIKGRKAKTPEEPCITVAVADPNTAADALSLWLMTTALPLPEGHSLPPGFHMGSQESYVCQLHCPHRRVVWPSDVFAHASATMTARLSSFAGLRTLAKHPALAAYLFHWCTPETNTWSQTYGYHVYS